MIYKHMKPNESTYKVNRCKLSVIHDLTPLFILSMRIKIVMAHEQ